MTPQRDFSDGSQDAYQELPVKVTGLGWRRGNSQLSGLREKDPAQYYGGWRGFVNDKDGNPNPILPLPVVTRENDTGKSYQVFSATHIFFVPIRARTRFELRIKVKDETTGQDRNRVVALSKNRIKGYEPHRQAFGLVISKKDIEQRCPALLYIDKWSSFISFEKAGEKWKKIAPQPNSLVVRCYGTAGKNVDNKRVPNFETYGQSKSTPIEALGLDKPMFYIINDELDDLFDRSLAWQTCARWNANGEVVEDRAPTALELFSIRAKELNLSSADIEQVLAENDGNYSRALDSIQETPEDELVPPEEDEPPF